MLERAAVVRIGVIADTSLQRHLLQQTLSHHGYEVVFNGDPLRADLPNLAEYQAALWLVDLVQEEECELVEQLLEGGTPVLFGEGAAPERNSELFSRWQRRLLGKLKKLLGEPLVEQGNRLQALERAPLQAPLTVPAALAQQSSCVGRPAEQVWLLAASLGGPAAVKAFLDALPGALPIGFLYAQHIDAHFEAALPRAVGRHSQWPINSARQGQPVGCGEVVVVPIGQELCFNEQGQMQLIDRPWPEPYSPSIDRMMFNLAEHFAERCGVIVFSGMGNDGSAAAAFVRRQGGRIWTQTAESCACASMPQSLCDLGFAQYSGDPQALAMRVINHLATLCELN